MSSLEDIASECPAAPADEHACALLLYCCRRCGTKLRPDRCEACGALLSPEQMHDLEIRCALCTERGGW